MKIVLGPRLSRLLSDARRAAQKINNLRGPGIDNRGDTLSINFPPPPPPVSIGDDGSPSPFVYLTQTGGAQGDASNPATWEYDVEMQDGTVFAAADVTVAFQRPNGRRTSGLIGMGYSPDGDTFILQWADEVPFTYACPSPP